MTVPTRVAEAAYNPEPADVLLADGTVAVVRALAPTDAEELHRLHATVSDDSLHLRFFGSGRAGAHHYVDHLLRDQPLALVLERDGRILGLATAEPVDDAAMEVAFLVDDSLQGRGAGSLLLEHLAAAARERGTEWFVAEVLADNRLMLQVFADAGFVLDRHLEAGEVAVRLDIASSSASAAAADARERTAEARSLRPLLHPRSVAVVGVRRDGQGIGAAVLASIRAGGFTGALHVVHPVADELDGVRAVPSLTALADPVDLVVIAVPAPLVVAALEDAAEAGVPTAVVISSGFGEMGEAGARAQRELAAVARARSIRVVGPNCLGLICNHPDVRLNASFSSCVPPYGGLAVATQSGGVGIVLADLARELGLGIGSLVSLGNKADVSGNDLLAAWTDDPEVTAAALYLESFGNARKFARLARRFAERKPLLAVLGGRSIGGRRAGASHTAATATPAVGAAAVFAQAGVIECNGPDDLAEAAYLLSCEPLPGGPRIGVISNAGGMGVLAADAAEDWGLLLPTFSPRLQAELAEVVQGTTGTSNPVDAGAGATAARLTALTGSVLASDEVDVVLVVVVATSISDGSGVGPGLARIRGEHPGVPLVLVHLGAEVASGEAGPTTYRSIEAAVRALGRAVRYAAWRTDNPPLPDLSPATPPATALARRRLAGRLLASAPADGWLDADASAALFAQVGWPPLGDVVWDPTAAVAAAQRVGYPVALKVGDGEVVHRTERGLVRVGLADADAVREAVRDFEGELGRAGGPVVVQPMVRGVEVVVGMVRDAVVGPVVMVGAGGVETDVRADRVHLVTPITERDARRALRSLRMWPLLDGFRGAEPVDVDALVRLLTAVGRLVDDVPEVAELDLNPVVVTPAGAAIVDIKVRLAAHPGPGGDVARQLRRRAPIA